MRSSYSWGDISVLSYRVFLKSIQFAGEMKVKIRWTEDSIRFRITPSEMEQLQRGESVEEILTFGSGQWAAQIVPTLHHHLLFSEGRVTIELSAEDLAVLAVPENEGVYFHQDALPNRYFIEKDYPCAHPRSSEAMEPMTETFTAPDDFLEKKLSP